MATSVVIFEKGKGGTIRGTLNTQTVLMPDSGWDAGEWRAREAIIMLLIVGGIRYHVVASCFTSQTLCCCRRCRCG
jgi:hypothetical protein